jgi:hypothetical protein
VRHRPDNPAKRFLYILPRIFQTARRFQLVFWVNCFELPAPWGDFCCKAADLR